MTFGAARSQAVMTSPSPPIVVPLLTNQYRYLHWCYTEHFSFSSLLYSSETWAGHCTVYVQYSHQTRRFTWEISHELLAEVTRSVLERQRPGHWGSVKKPNQCLRKPFAAKTTCADLDMLSACQMSGSQSNSSLENFSKVLEQSAANAKGLKTKRLVCYAPVTYLLAS